MGILSEDSLFDFDGNGKLDWIEESEKLEFYERMYQESQKNKHDDTEEQFNFEDCDDSDKSDDIDEFSDEFDEFDDPDEFDDLSDDLDSAADFLFDDTDIL